MKVRRQQEEFIKSLLSKQPQHLNLSFPLGCTWDQVASSNYQAYQPAPSTHQLRTEWANLLKQILQTKEGDTCSLYLDCNNMNLKHMEGLSYVMQQSFVKTTEIAIHNIEALIPYSFDLVLQLGNVGSNFSSGLSQSTLFQSSFDNSSLSQSTLFQSSFGNPSLSQSILSRSVLSQSISSQSVFSELIRVEQNSLKECLQHILEKASKVNFTNLPLFTTCELMFDILGNIKCGELSISSNNFDHNLVGPHLYQLMVQNKNLAKLDISNFPLNSFSQASELILMGCHDNSKLEVKYSNIPLRGGEEILEPGNKMFFDFSQIRMEPLKDDFIKTLLLVAKELVDTHGFPKDVVTIIMEYVDPYNYMETNSYFQPDGQHIIPLLGYDEDIIEAGINGDVSNFSA